MPIVAGVFQDASDGKSLSGRRFPQLILIIPGDAAYEADVEVGTLVLYDIAAEEVAEIVNDNLADSWMVKMRLYKRRQRSKKPIRHRLTVDAGNNVANRQTHRSLEIRHYIIVDKAFIERIQEADA